jgi:subtilisin family serine protease
MSGKSAFAKAAVLLLLAGCAAGLALLFALSVVETDSTAWQTERPAHRDAIPVATALPVALAPAGPATPDGQPIFPELDSKASHPAERFLARSTMLASRVSPEGGGRWTRELLVQRPSRSDLFRVEESWIAASNGADPRLASRRIYSASQIMVRLPPGITPAEFSHLIRPLDLAVGRAIVPGVVLVRVGQTGIDGVPQALELLSSLGIKAEPDAVGFGAGTVPNDPLFPQQWNLHNTGQAGGEAGIDVAALLFWEADVDRSGVTIAVLDTGVFFDHPDLKEVAWDGYDFVNDDEDPSDDNFSVDAKQFGHGTAVTGVIFASRDNGEGVAGLLPEARLLVVKVLDEEVSGLTSQLIAGLDYARGKGADVINMSLIGYSPPGQFPTEDSLLAEQFRHCREAGIILCVAAGNSGTDNDISPDYPSSYPDENIVSVGAHGPGGQRWDNSNFGAETVDLFAPGESIRSPSIPTEEASYLNWQGTSFATPHVTAAVAALRALKPHWNVRQIKAVLLSSTVKTIALAEICVSGGRLDMGRAVALTQSPDREPPRLELIGEPSIELSWGDDFTDPGALVLDNEDEDRVVFSEDIVQTSAPGTYTLSYTAVDATGNTAETLERTVHVLAVAPNLVGTLPIDTRVQVGGRVVLRAVNTGSPATFQWYRVVGDQPPQLLAGATSNELVFEEAREDDAAGYYVEATNCAGSRVSRTATVSVRQRDYRTVRGTYLGNVLYNGRPGWVSLRLRQGVLTGQLRIGGETVKLRGRLDGQGRWSRVLAAELGGKITVAVQGGPASELIGVVIGRDLSTLLPAMATGFPMAGWRLNQLMTEEATDGWPHGFASLGANAKGVLRLAGRLGNGRPLSGSIRAVQDPRESGQAALPVFLRAKGPAALVWGDLDIEAHPVGNDPHIEGTLAYAENSGGDSRELRVAGRRWLPRLGGSIFASDAATAASSVDVLIQIDTNPATDLVWPPSNKAVAPNAGLRLSANRRTGVFKGSVKNADLPGTLRGVFFAEDFVIEEGDDPFRGAGLFQSANQVQAVRITMP